MKIAILAACENENIDKFWQKSNKTSDSFCTVGLRSRKQSIAPRLKCIESIMRYQACEVENEMKNNSQASIRR